MYTYNYCFRYWEKEEKQAFAHLGKTPFLSLFQDQLHSASVLLLHFTLSPLHEAKHVQGCCGALIPLHALSIPSSFLSSSSPPALVFPLLFLTPSPPLSLPLLVGLGLFPCTFLHFPEVPPFLMIVSAVSCDGSIRASWKQLCHAWGCPVPLPTKASPASPPAATTLKSEQEPLPYSAKWEICCEVCFGLFEEWDCLFFWRTIMLNRSVGKQFAMVYIYEKSRLNIFLI